MRRPKTYLLPQPKQNSAGEFVEKTALAFAALETHSVIGYRKDGRDRQFHIVVAVIGPKGTYETDYGPFGVDETRIKDLISHIARVLNLPRLSIRYQEEHANERREYSWITSEAQRAAKIRTTKGVVSGSPKIRSVQPNKKLFLPKI